MTEKRASLEELIRSVLSYWRVDNEPTITDTIASTLLEHPEVVLAALGQAEKTKGNIDRILWNDEDANDIDEVVIHNATVHVEQMDKRCWWIGIYPANGVDRYWMGNFTADSRGRMRFSEQENAGIEWDREGTHTPRGEYLYETTKEGGDA